MSFRDQNTTLKDYLIAFLCSGKSIKSFHYILNQRALKNYKKSTVQRTLYRLDKLNLINSNKNEWGITEKGIDYLNKQKLFYTFISPFNKKSLRNTLIAFDIPEKDRKKRNWIRSQLKIYGYIMVQQSLWHGPGPLPKEFLDKLKELGLKKNIKIFKVLLNK